MAGRRRELQRLPQLEEVAVSQLGAQVPTVVTPERRLATSVELVYRVLPPETVEWGV
jgi:hypothetical protein